MKLLITGACGFIGYHACLRFLREGSEVVGLDNLSRPGSYYTLQELKQQQQFTFAHADIRCTSELHQLFKRFGPFDVVIHAAGQVAVTTSVIDPRTDFEINAAGTLNILELIRSSCPSAFVIYTSTNKVYGKLDDLEVCESETRYEYKTCQGVPESTQLDFHSPYGCSKGTAEQYVRDYARIYGLNTLVLRQSCIYGTHQYGLEDQGWVAWFVIAAALNKSVTIYGDGKQVRDLLWVDDLVEAFRLAIEKRSTLSGMILNLGGGRHNSMSILELLALIRQNGLELQPRMAGWRPGDQKIFLSDTTRAQVVLGWKPAVSPGEGVSRLCKWVKSEKDMLTRILVGVPAASGGLRLPPNQPQLLGSS